MSEATGWEYPNSTAGISTLCEIDHYMPKCYWRDIGDRDYISVQIDTERMLRRARNRELNRLLNGDAEQLEALR
jgi:hypothetical protein